MEWPGKRLPTSYKHQILTKKWQYLEKKLGCEEIRQQFGRYLGMRPLFCKVKYTIRLEHLISCVKPDLQLLFSHRIADSIHTNKRISGRIFNRVGFLVLDSSYQIALDSDSKSAQWYKTYPRQTWKTNFTLELNGYKLILRLIANTREMEFCRTRWLWTNN